MDYSDFDIRRYAGFSEKTELEVYHDTHTGFCFSPTLCSNIFFCESTFICNYTYIYHFCIQMGMRRDKLSRTMYKCVFALLTSIPFFLVLFYCYYYYYIIIIAIITFPSGHTV